jgi:hypothetical protein
VAWLNCLLERTDLSARKSRNRNLDQARWLLALAGDKIVLVPEGRLLVTEITGYLAGVLTLDYRMFGSVGAGRGI